MSIEESRRDFLKTAGLGVAGLTLAVGELAAQSSPAADPTAWSGTDAVAALKAKRISAEELVKAAIARADRLKSMNLFTSMDPGKAIAAARAIDERRARGEDVGPLAGLPLIIKDNIDSAALPTTAGSPAFEGWQPKADAPVLAALLRGGGVLLGKANMGEMALGGADNPVYGTVANPYHLRANPGVSSSGTAAAVAARVVTGGLGADTGGSIRMPAAMCGCVGLRPTLGRYSTAGMIGFTWTMDTPGPIARTVDDVILLDSVCARRSATVATISFAGTRLGIPRSYYEGMEPGLAVVVSHTLEVLRAAGAVLVEVDVPPDLRQAPGYGAAEAPRLLATYLAEHGSRMTVFDVIEKVRTPMARDILMRMLQGPPSDGGAWIDNLTSRRAAHIARVHSLFKESNVTAMLFPTTQRPGETPEEVEEAARQSGAAGARLGNPNSGLASGAGLPGLSVPVGLTIAGRPVGMEFVAPQQADGTVLALGRALEKLVGLLPPPPLA